MFTGLVQQLGEVVALQEIPAGRRLLVDAAEWTYQPAPGDSIAVDGCCLTAVDPEPNQPLRFDLIHQTLRETTLGARQPGDRVNLEHACTPTTLLGGHVVQGHVDGVGEVASIVRRGGEWRVQIVPPERLMRYVAARGSIAVNGVSLTIAETDARSLTVALIPTTLELTNLSSLSQGDGVNLETDYLAKVVVNWLERTR